MKNIYIKENPVSKFPYEVFIEDLYYGSWKLKASAERAVKWLNSKINKEVN